MTRRDNGLMHFLITLSFLFLLGGEERYILVTSLVKCINVDGLIAKRMRIIGYQNNESRGMYVLLGICRCRFCHPCKLKLFTCAKLTELSDEWMVNGAAAKARMERPPTPYMC